MNGALFDERNQGLEVRDVWLQQRLSDFSDAGHDRLMVVSELIEENPPRERVAVRVQSGRRQSDEDVAFTHGFSVEQIFFIDHADDEAGDVVVIIPIEAGHLGGFAANQRAAVLRAAAGHSANHIGHHFRSQPASRVVVEKKKWAGALHEDVVHTVAYKIVSDGVVDLHRLRDTQFRADAVGR